MQNPEALNPPAAPGRRLVSLIIPMLNEREGLRLLFDRIAAAIKDTREDWEFVVVDDGSTDGTRDAVPGELARFPRWRLVVLSRNFGQQPAYRAGLEHARGEAVIFLDADLQDPPELIPELLAKWQAGYKVVHWSFASGDPVRGLQAQGLTDWVLSKTKPGSILIFHINGRGWSTAQALPGILDALQKKGYGFTRLDAVLP